MKLLLDTHVLVWYLTDFQKIPSGIQDTIHNKDNTVYISLVSIWEIVIKMNIEKLEMKCTVREMVNIVKAKNFKIINIRIKMLEIYRHLPLIHRDPFDRLLVSTAISENLTLITSDKENQQYNLNWLW